MLGLLASPLVRQIAAAAAIAVAVVAAAALVYGLGRSDGALSVQVRWDEERIAQANAVQQSTEKARLAQAEATATVNRNRERENETRASIDRRYRADLERLRQQTADRRAGNLPPAPGENVDRTACAGVAAGDGGQSAEVSEWLLAYAADAARLQASYAACVAWADAVERMTR